MQRRRRRKCNGNRAYLIYEFVFIIDYFAMKEQLLQRTNIFSHNAVDLALELPNTYLGNHIKGQLIRCSTSVAANYRAACLAQSKKSFVAKLSIVIEEADESIFWIEFSIKRKLLLKERAKISFKERAKISFLEAKELTSIFVSSRKTINTQINNK